MKNERFDLTETSGIVETLRIIGGKWKPLILYILLYDGKQRFGELRKKLPNISQGTLTKQLRELEKDKIVVRTVYPQVPPKVEYTLSDHSRTLDPILIAMCNWGRSNTNK